MFSIGLRYCGGCNSQIDRSKIVREVKEGLERQGLEVFFSREKEGIFDIVFLLSGCRHACAEKEFTTPDAGTRMLSVKGDIVDDVYLAEKDIPSYSLKSLRTSMRGIQSIHSASRNCACNDCYSDGKTGA